MERAAEIEKLARLLGAGEAELACLDALEPEEIRGLREAATDRLFDADRALFDRLAAGAAVVPDALAATLSQKAFGPLLTGRLTSAVDPKKAVALAKRLPHDFLADVAIELDPRRAAAVLRGLPPEHIAATSRVLVSRGEWVAMGRYVGHLTDDAIRAVAVTLSDEELARLAPLIEDPEGIERVAALLGWEP